MPIRLSVKDFFTEKLDSTYPGLEGIDHTFLTEGQEAAEHRFSEFIRNGGLDDKSFFAESNPFEPTEKEKDWIEKVVDGWVSSVGVPAHFPNRKVDWYSNPTYNGYLEWPWQLSRHGEWASLGRFYRLTGDERYAEAFSDYFMSWAEQTETPAEGTSGFDTLAWRTLEAGIRLSATWPIAIMSTFRSPSLSDRMLTDFFRSVWENARRIITATTSHNWLIAEMTGLTSFGVFFPFFRDAAPYDEYAINRLTNELKMQLYPDHFQQELTTGYHYCVIDSYLEAMKNHRLTGKPISSELRNGVADMFLLFIQLRTPDGATPDLNDGGHMNACQMSKLALSVFPERKDDFIWFASEGKEGNPPKYNSLLMPYSGFAVMRSGWGRNDSFALLENAPFGKAHQHEDKLQIILHAYGKCLLDDPGTFLYDASKMREYVIGPYSHNSGLVDGFGQNRRSHYHWSNSDIEKLSGTEFKAGDNYEIARGSYDEGYGPDLISVKHERTLLWEKNGIPGIPTPFWIVYDRFIPNDGNQHSYTLLWHLADVPASVEGNAVLSDYGDGVSFTILSNANPTIVKGQKEPLFIGWHPIKTPGDHEHIPTPSVMAKLPDGITCAATLLFPVPNGTCPVKSVLCDENGTVTLTTEKGNSVLNLFDLF